MYKTLIKKIGLFITSGYIYYLLECLYRGYSHVSMFILVGLLSVLVIDTPNNIYGYDLDYRLQVLISSILATVGECITGLIVNVWLKLNVWDYSDLPFTFAFGQCNLFFCIAWVFLIGLIGIPYCDAYNYYIAKDGDIAPYYRIENRVIYAFKSRNKSLK
jgi:uncharacterized membrane protein